MKDKYCSVCIKIFLMMQICGLSILFTAWNYARCLSIIPGCSSHSCTIPKRLRISSNFFLTSS